MAAFNNKVKVNSKQNRSTLDLSCSTVCTSDFNVVKPIHVQELVPGQSIHLNCETVVRLQPLNCPTFGRADITTRTFFVPYRLAWHKWDYFYQRRPCPSSNSQSFYTAETTPVVTSRILASSFVNVNNLDHDDPIQNNIGDLGVLRLFDSVSENSADGYDFEIYNGVSSRHEYCRFTQLGKRLYDLLLSLGYRLDFSYANDRGTGNIGVGISDEHQFSLLPLYAWTRLFNDWYMPKKYNQIINLDYYRDSVTCTPANLQILLYWCKFMLFRYYGNDIFSIAETQPFRQSIDNTPQASYPCFTQNVDDTMPNSAWKTNDIVNGDSLYGSRFYQSGYLNPHTDSMSIRTAMRVMQFLQRNNLIGSRFVEYIKAKFGVTPQSEALDVTDYLAHNSQPIQISDILGTSENNLGELGGKGYSYSRDGVNYTAKEFGLLITVSEIRPHGGYFQGCKPHTTRVNPSQFFTPEYDGLGFSPVGKYSLLDGWDAQPEHSIPTRYAANKVFGYLPTYWDYKCAFDSVTGDFNVRSLRTGLDSFHLFRQFPLATDNKSNSMVRNTFSFHYPPFNDSYYTYDRIFQDNNVRNDHFICIHAFDIKSSAPMLALSESWLVNEEGEETFGSETTINGNLG